jgi:integrase
MATEKSPLDRGLYERQTAGGQTVYDVRLRINGRRTIVGSGFTTKLDARAQRDRVRTEIRDKVYSPATYSRRKTAGVTVSALTALVVADYRRNKRKSLHSALQLEGAWATIASARLADSITGNTLLAWADEWLKAKLSSATINRRIGFLLRAYRLGQEATPPLVTSRPVWHGLSENVPRTGFIEWPMFEQLRSALPRYAQIPVTIGFWTGMRYGEIAAMSWPQLTFDVAKRRVTFLLAGGQTKNRRARTVVLSGDLYDTLLAWREESKLRWPLCKWVCHRAGRPIGTIDTIWKSTCIQLGLGTGTWDVKQHAWTQYEGLLFHDLRRSGVRNLVRAGVPEKIVMSISGHKTRSVFDRYNIVNEEDMAVAGDKLWEYTQEKFQIGSTTKSTTCAKVENA